MNNVFHVQYFQDLSKIEEQLSEKNFAELLSCIDKAIREIQKDPCHEGAPCRFEPLTNYRKKKFHSVLRPKKGQRADYRLVFRYEASTNDLFLLGIGQRKFSQEDDIWQRLKDRDHTNWLR